MKWYQRHIIKETPIFLRDLIFAILFGIFFYALSQGKKLFHMSTVGEFINDDYIKTLPPILAGIVFMFVVVPFCRELRIRNKLRFFNNLYYGLFDLLETALYKLKEVKKESSNDRKNELRVNGNICKELIKVAKSILKSEIIPYVSEAPIRDHDDAVRVFAISSIPPAKWFTPGLMKYLSLNAEKCSQIYECDLKKDQFLALLEEVSLKTWKKNEFHFIRLFIYDSETYENDRYLKSLIEIHKKLKIPCLCLLRDKIMDLILKNAKPYIIKNIVEVIKWQLNIASEKKGKLFFLKKLLEKKEIKRHGELFYWINQALLKQSMLFDFVKFDSKDGKTSKAYFQERITSNTEAQLSLINVIKEIVKTDWIDVVYEGL